MTNVVTDGLNFSQMMWLVHGMHRNNVQCNNHVSQLFISKQNHYKFMHVFSKSGIHFTPSLQKAYMKKVFVRITQTTGQSGDMCEFERDVVRTLQNGKDIVGDIVGGSAQGIEIRGKYG